MTWIALSEEEKQNVINYCNEELGKEKPDMFVETGEPCYLDEDCNMIDISEVIEGFWIMNAKKEEQ